MSYPINFPPKLIACRAVMWRFCVWLKLQLQRCLFPPQGCQSSQEHWSDLECMRSSNFSPASVHCLPDLQSASHQKAEDSAISPSTSSNPSPTWTVVAAFELEHLQNGLQDNPNATSSLTCRTSQARGQPARQMGSAAGTQGTV